MAGGGGGSNTTHALLSPDPETLPIGGVSRPATGEFLGAKGLQGQPTVAPYAPLTELVAENGLFQPKLILPQKSPKLTPRLDPGQLTLCPSGIKSLEPSSNLVPSEVPASGYHGFVKWGHDAKITKIGVIPTRSSPGHGKANDSQDRRHDLGLISECTTWN